MLVPDRQPEKTALIRQFAPLVAPVRVATATPVEPASLRAPLETLRRRLRLATEETKSDKGRREVQAVLAKLDALLARLDGADARRAGPALEQLQDEVARDFAGKLELPEEPRPAPGRARRHAARAARALHRGERAFPDPRPSRRGHLGEGGGGALRGRPPARWIPT